MLDELVNEKERSHLLPTVNNVEKASFEPFLT